MEKQYAVAFIVEPETDDREHRDWMDDVERDFQHEKEDLTEWMEVLEKMPEGVPYLYARLQFLAERLNEELTDPDKLQNYFRWKLWVVYSRCEDGRGVAGFLEDLGIGSYAPSVVSKRELALHGLKDLLEKYEFVI